MKLLVLGGTVFLGRHVVAEALASGHEVTIFTRGQTNPELFPEAEHLIGDRDGNLEALRGRTWDGVIDTCGFVPRIVRQSAELLRDSVGRYVFVSSISVYADFRRPYDETAVTGALDDPTSEDVSAHYGPLKAACERILDEIYGARSTQIRAGLIVGPYDPTDRFTYWPVRISEGDNVLAPSAPDRPVQFIDARDLAIWLIDLATNGPGGPINATGPATTLTMGELLERMISVIGSDCHVTWIDGDTLVAAGVQPWTELPLWVPGPEYEGFLQASISRALEAGLALRPLEQTAVETLAWSRAVGEQRETLTRERERELLGTHASP